MACALTNSAPIEASDISRDVHTKFGDDATYTFKQYFQTFALERGEVTGIKQLPDTATTA